MIILALLDIDERTACDLACQVAALGVSVRKRLRTVAERALQERPDAVRVRWAALARQDGDEMEQRLRRSGEVRTG